MRLHPVLTRFVFPLLAFFGASFFLPRGQSAAEDGADRLAAEPTLSVGITPAFGGRTFDRPVLVTHANDARLFVVEQRGRILVFDNETSDPSTFLDIRKSVRYSDSQNEEGLLGVAFHPKFLENGQLFVYYSTRAKEPEKPHVSVISRFQVLADGSSRGDPATEQIILTIEQPFWNHDGGTILFGPDGFLYIGLGDGGAARDPHGNGQNLGTLLGSILRIDVDKREGDREYAIPKDNPFVDQKGARPEIFAYGLRNVWRMAFDRETGLLWAGDVGQDIWEEIDVIRKGGNYGWNRREGMHSFGEHGSEPAPELIEPILEYHHDVGKSITGGAVYRGKAVPALYGKYVFADYVSGRIWALDYDERGGEIRANYRIPAPNHPIMSFGEDADSELYFTTSFGNIFRFIAGDK